MSVPELLRAIAEHEPAPPRSLRKEIPDEVDAIVLKALRKDPAERYQTAGKLARDLEAHLAPKQAYFEGLLGAWAAGDVGG